MKKIGKISINPEKLIKNEELVNLRGGYDLGCDPNAGLLCSFSQCMKINGEMGECSHIFIGGSLTCACT